MELLIQNLPSGYPYDFQSLRINPMNFSQILEYLEFVPTAEVEKFYFDYKLVLNDDLNVDNLLLCDLEYVVFYKKAITISKDVDFKTTTQCPKHKTDLGVSFKLSDVKFTNLDETLRNGLSVEIDGSYHNVRMPKVSEFMKIFSNYRRYKKVTDMRLIKLIALFENSDTYLQKYENLVLNATYKGITVLTMLDNLYYKVVEPMIAYCPDCKADFELLRGERVEELSLIHTEEAKKKIDELNNAEYGGMVIEIKSLISNFFRDVVDNNGLTKTQVVSRKIRKSK